MTKINELKHYHKNPRKITDQKFEQLGESLEKYGDLGGVVVNVRTGEVIGGNQRTKFFKEHEDEVTIEKKEVKRDTQGTVALGYIVYKGTKFNYREVDWDADTEARANIVANKVTGFWDNEILLEGFDEELLLETGFESFELSFFEDKSRPKIDVDNFNDTLDTYLDGEIKQVVLYMDSATYEDVLKKCKEIMEKIGVDNNTDVFMKALNEYYEKNISK